MAEQAINNEIDRLVAVKAEIADAIKLIVNEDQRLLLELRYLCFHSWEQIAVKLRISCTYAFKMHRQALEDLDIMLEAKRRYADG